MIIAQCKGCSSTATVSGTQDVHEAVDAAGCRCCTVDHHHGLAAGDAERGGTPCRPLLITLTGGEAQVS